MHTCRRCRVSGQDDRSKIYVDPASCDPAQTTLGSLAIEYYRVIITTYIVVSSGDSKNGDAQEMSTCTHVAGAGSRGQTTAPKIMSTLRLVTQPRPHWVHLL